jgi:hypothetical protein
VTADILGTPRPAPATRLPTAAGAVVLALALPVFLIAGWDVASWALAAVVWVASQAFGLLLGRLRTRTGNLAAAGVLGVGMMFRAMAVMVTLFAVAASDGALALSAALVYALAYSAELALSLVAYAGGPAA